jgi:hypothetical protein
MDEWACKLFKIVYNLLVFNVIGEFRMESKVVYTGHVGDGGLQGHSIGKHYPWTVRGVSKNNNFFWQAFNCNTGQVGGLYFTHRGAESEIEFLHN